MKPVDQQVIDKDVGDCWTCCIASVLELLYVDVPRFVMAEVWYGIPHYQYCWEWLQPRGLWISGLSPDIARGELPDEKRAPWAHDADLPPYLIASGWSPRGEWHHAVVWDRQKQRIAHDPYPSRDGLRGGAVHFEAILPVKEH